MVDPVRAVPAKKSVPQDKVYVTTTLTDGTKVQGEFSSAMAQKATDKKTGAQVPIDGDLWKYPGQVNFETTHTEPKTGFVRSVEGVQLLGDGCNADSITKLKAAGVDVEQLKLLADKALRPMKNKTTSDEAYPALEQAVKAACTTVRNNTGYSR